MFFLKAVKKNNFNSLSTYRLTRSERAEWGKGGYGPRHRREGSHLVPSPGNVHAENPEVRADQGRPRFVVLHPGLQKRLPPLRRVSVPRTGIIYSRSACHLENTELALGYNPCSKKFSPGGWNDGQGETGEQYVSME